jgi:hypothetical protein
MRYTSVVRAISLVLAAIAVFGVLGWVAYRLWQRSIDVWTPAFVARWEQSDEAERITLPGRFLVAELGRYDDEFLAYLMFDYFRSSPQFRNSEVLLSCSSSGAGLSYRAEAHLPNDLLSSVWLLAEAHARGLINETTWRYVPGEVLDELRHQTRTALTAYSYPTSQRLEDYSHEKLVALTQRFVQFKSLTDPRIRRKIEPVPRPLTSVDAHRLAENIVNVAGFYELPLDHFLGIGAMENNYLTVEGDLKNVIWKLAPEPGDVVLKRSRGKALVHNPSSGVWQITRETLRYAHRLYLRDDRDYSLLPQRLHPPTRLDVKNVPPEVLTTYAGLVFRDLLDRSTGDVAVAVGAYNGGLRKPNQVYAAGVQLVAEYARRTLESAAALDGPIIGRCSSMDVPAVVTP